MDWDSYNGGRSERVDIVDDNTGNVLNTQTISGFQNGVYLVWNLTGSVTVRVTNLNPASNAVLEGLFFGAGAPPSSSSAAFVKSDPTTHGNWKGVYGADGFNIVGDAVNYPSYALVTPAGQASYTWASSTSDTRALQKSATGSTDRVAATWYSATQFSIDVKLTDSQTHQLALYAVDWDNWGGGRSERVDIVDDNTGNVLNSQTISGFQNGVYLVWNLTGSVTVRVTNLNPPSNAVIEGLFFGPGSGSSSSSAAFVKSDTSSQGNWKGVYGADGFNVVADAVNYPSYALVTPSGQSTYVWGASAFDVRALQKSAAGSTDRIAATWFSGTQFSVDVKLTDGQTHQFALYAMDWDGYNGGRSERIDIVDDNTGTVLNSQTISAFQNGVYLVWNLTGSVTVRVTNLNPASNAVVEGLFFR
jgi:uncharacterized Rmd1/YagE family protein